MASSKHTVSGPKHLPWSWAGSTAWASWFLRDLSPLSYFFGAFLGDGYAAYAPEKKRYYVRMACAEEEIGTRCNAEIKAFFPEMREARIGQRIVNQGTVIYIVQWNSIPLTQFLLCATNEKKRMPQYIWKASEGARLAFLAGLMDTDGSISLGIVSKKKKCRDNYLRFAGAHGFVQEFGKLCASIGIHTTVSANNGGPYGTKRQLHYRLSLPSAVSAGFYFHCARKQILLEQYRKDPTSRLRLRRDYATQLGFF